MSRSYFMGVTINTVNEKDNSNKSECVSLYYPGTDDIATRIIHFMEDTDYIPEINDITNMIKYDNYNPDTQSFKAYRDRKEEHDKIIVDSNDIFYSSDEVSCVLTLEKIKCIIKLFEAKMENKSFIKAINKKYSDDWSEFYTGEMAVRDFIDDLKSISSLCDIWSNQYNDFKFTETYNRDETKIDHKEDYTNFIPSWICKYRQDSGIKYDFNSVNFIFWFS